MSNVSLSDHVANAEVACNCRLWRTPLEDMLRERRLRWFGHVKRRFEEETIRQVVDVAGEEDRRCSRSTKTWRRWGC